MKEFKYVASKKDGTRVEGTTKAATYAEVVTFLHQNNLIIISIEESIGFDFKKLGDIQIGGMPLKEKMIIAKQLATMLGAGLPLIQTLEVLVDQSQNRVIKNELREIFKDVEGGLTLSKAFRKNSKIFDELQINLIEAGEKSGNLVEILLQIAVDLEKKNNLDSKIRGAMIYPAIIFLAMVIVIVVMMVFLIPAVKSLYKDFGIETLPAPTQIMVDISNFVTNPLGAIITIITIISMIVGFRAYYSSKGGREAIDRLLLKAPIFGQITELGQLVQMTRLLSMLIKSGVPIIDSLKTTASSLSNVHYRKASEQAALDVGKGVPIAVSLTKSDVMPIMLLKMVAIGEDTGTLDKMLTDMSNYYETELNNITDNLTKLMEPVILLVFGGVVGFLAVAIYLPIYQITSV